LFSSSGFDIMDTITRLVNRPNPTVALGPVDFSCAFLVADALKPDLTIVYVNPAFTRLTGYESRECIGRNCRFLQWPNGALDHRTNELNALSLNRIRAALSTNSEFQISLINYRKNGDQFHNLITGIPV
ncbi:PAS domain-containing protein, partial [Cantharellus anzutake]|uniref:PAS domain-containing protein n=1 Tax=Cantharellus anzutake TaxID=1750568 RepID=UPI00190524BD